MPKGQKLTLEESQAEIELQLQRKAKYQGVIKQQEFWLEHMCTGFTSQDEQQHIVYDIRQMQDWIQAIDKRVAKLQARIQASN